MLILVHQQQTAFENIVGKGEIARNEQCLFFPQCFLVNKINVCSFVHIFDIIFLFAAELEKPKIGISAAFADYKISVTEKKKMLITSIFSFSHIFKWHFPLSHLNCIKGIKASIPSLAHVLG